MGSALVEQLLAAGEQVRVVVRSADKGRAAAGLGAQVAVADVQDGASFTAALEVAGSLFLNTASLPGFVQADKSAIDTAMAVAAGDQDITHAAVPQLGQHRHPHLGPSPPDLT